MPKIYGQLERAALEVLSSNPTAGITGRIIWNSTDERANLDDGTNNRYLLRNDQKAIFGNHATPANNIRFHRGASGVLQFVSGADTTAEGTLSTALNQTSGRIENYTFAGKPAAGNAGRLAWITDQSRLMADTGAAWIPVGSSGGGGSLEWVEDAAAPVATIEYNNQVYLYEAGQSQDLFALIRVPNSYVAGSQINLRLPIYSPDNTGTILLSTQSTLYRAATDALSSSANQRTSTNSAVSLGAGTVDEAQNVVFDLTDTSGQINGVAVSANDLIKVRLFRGTDTATSDIRALTYATEVTFT